jgi:hypothetical protein
LFYSILQFDLNLNLIKEWVGGANEAAKELNINPVNIRQCCTGLIKTCNKFIWKYKNI